MYQDNVYVQIHTELSSLIINKITGNLPHFTFAANLVSIPKYIKLADERYNESREIDVLLGANIFWNLLTDGHFNLGKNSPVLKNAKLGWVISGNIPVTQSRVYSFANTSLEKTVQSL